MERVNKSLVVNLICLAWIGLGHTVAPEAIKAQVLGMGYFGFSGAVTNWLAIHMLFEKVPFLYGSGIIPLKFEAFKAAIRTMIMTQFFTVENISKFLERNETGGPDLTPVIENLNYDPIFDGFLETVQNSKFGGMLGFIGGIEALEPMRENFKTTLKAKLLEIVTTQDLAHFLAPGGASDLEAKWQKKIEAMVESRLEELTPQMVKEIIQNMIRDHLGWLVVWGGVFGGLIGLLTSLLP